jgi:membrane protease YdiL (CAAX protease family)
LSVEKPDSSIHTVNELGGFHISDKTSNRNAASPVHTGNVDSTFAKPITKSRYLLGLLIILGAAYSQYVLPSFGPALGFLVVYGLPIVAVSVLWGRNIIEKAGKKTWAALKLGLGFYGAFTALGLLASYAILFALTSFDPAALNLLHKPNPVLNVSTEYAWIMVALSLLIVGPAEEYLFRGFVFGGLLSLFKSRHWLTLSLVSSVFFAAAHLYYGLVYGVASALSFTDLVTFGIAMCVTYYLSGGNLLVPAVVHGVYDATGFLGVATSSQIGTVLRVLMLLIGIAVGLGLFINRTRKRTPMRSSLISEKIMHFQNKNKDLAQLSQQIVQQLQAGGYKVQSTTAPLGQVIQAQKAGIPRDIITAERAFTIMIAGQPNDFTVHIGIGKWIQNIAVAAAEALLISFLLRKPEESFCFCDAMRKG